MTNQINNNQVQNTAAQKTTGSINEADVANELLNTPDAEGNMGISMQMESSSNENSNENKGGSQSLKDFGDKFLKQTVLGDMAFNPKEEDGAPLA